MKPEKGLEMDEKPCSPQELFTEIGLLVTEGRTPVRSTKGREEGPHCLPLKGSRLHECDRHKEQCRKASDFMKLQGVLWMNMIPMRVDILLFPNCEHGQREESVVEGAAISSVDNFELLERWDVQLVKKRSPERLDGFVSGGIHLQTVRSYLHFSQLSSWLISTGGALPYRVVYRAYAPGETVAYSFSSLPEVHNFPSADLGDFVMRTTVTHLPRFDKLIGLVCRSPSPCIEPHLRTKKQKPHEPAQSTSKYNYEYEKPKFKINEEAEMDHGKYEKQSMSEKPPIGQKSKKNQPIGKFQIRSEKIVSCPVSSTPKRKVDQMSPTISSHQPIEKEILSGSARAEDLCATIGFDSKPAACHSVITNKYATKSPSSTENVFKFPAPVSPNKVLSYKKPATLSVSTNMVVSSKRLPSPKVLMTASKKPEPSTFKKRCLDLTTCDTDKNNVDSFGVKNVQDFTANEICDLVKPLSPSDLEAYISSLSSQASKRHGVSKLEDIPTTKCRFYLGEGSLVNQSKKSAECQTDSVITCDNNCHVNQSSTDYKNHANQPGHLTVNQSGNTSCLSKTKINIGDRLKSSRVLFQKSLSTSEVEEELYGHSKHQCISTASSTVDKHETDTQDHIPPSSDIVRSNTSENASKSSEKQTCDINSQNTSDDASASISLAAKSRKQKLFDHSIPCSVGGVNVAMKSLLDNLESMEIDDRPCCSPVLDREVEGHLSEKNTEVENGKDESSKSQSSQSSDSAKADSPTRDSPSNRDLSLCKQLLQKEFHQNVKNEILSSKKALPSPDDIQNFRFVMGRSASAVFNSTTGLPSRSSPAPIKKKSGSKFDFDCSLTNVRAIKNALSCSKLTLQSEENIDTVGDPKIISTSAPASTNCLLGNFEESVLNGRIEPEGVVDGFSVEIGASGLFCPKHVTLPVAAYFFQLSDDNAPSPYLGHVNLEQLGKRGYHIPRVGTVQVTLFNPNRTVVKMFVVMYDLSDMPANCQTFLRQRTLYMPAEDVSQEPSFLRYLIHLRFQSSKSGKIYLHTDLRLIFARDKFEFDPRVANYELRSFTESPTNPKFSPKR